MMGVVFMIYVGMGTATSVRVAERYGRGDVVVASARLQGWAWRRRRRWA